MVPSTYGAVRWQARPAAILNRVVSVLVMTAFLVTACSGQKKVAPTPVPAEIDPANATYSIEGKPVTLVNGKADEPIVPGGASRHVTALTPFMARGDIEGDGQQDVAVLLTDNSGGSGVFYYLAAFPATQGPSTAAVFVGDRISVTNLAISDRKIVVSYLTRPDGAPFSAAPTVATSKTFTLTGGRLQGN